MEDVMTNKNDHYCVLLGISRIVGATNYAFGRPEDVDCL
jgi:hypothetical protein